MPVHWPCLLLMGCLHWLGKLWLDGQVTLLGMMEHLVFFLFFHLRFCSSCLVRMQFSHFWNMWIVEVLFCFSLGCWFNSWCQSFSDTGQLWSLLSVNGSYVSFLLLRRWHFGDSTNRALYYILSTLYCFWSQYRDIKENTQRCHLSVIDKNGSADCVSVCNPQ